ncbi:DUF3616 domain-containing protein [Myxococcaceae bacterium GXIMD 01537]
MRRLLSSAGWLLLVGCGAGGAAVRPGPEAPAPLVFEGGCDASGAVVLGGGLFVVGDDEDNILRVYDARRAGAPLETADLSPALELPVKKKVPEADIEAATGLDSLAFWLSSHGRSSSGKRAPSRYRFFATTAPADGKGLQVVGRPYAQLLEDLLADPRMARFNLAGAEALPPKTPGGLNIEGMTASADGQSILIGFRGPVPEGRALVVPLLNPKELLEGHPARFGDPRLLDLGGLGIRSMSSWRGHYLLIGGAIAKESPSRLFTWRGGDDTPRPVDVDLSGFNPEAFVSDENDERILVLSDDGTALIDGVECKRLEGPERKRFRGVWTRLLTP